MNQKGRRRRSRYAAIMIVAVCPYCQSTVPIERQRRRGDVILCPCSREFELGEIEGGDGH